MGFRSFAGQVRLPAPPLLSDVERVRRRSSAGAALRAGADGYLFKEDLDAKLAASVRELAAGGTPLSHAAAKALLGDLRHRSPVPSNDARLPSLTPREIATSSSPVVKTY